MNENMLSFNFPNFITVGIMVVVLMALLYGLAQTFHWSMGQWGNLGQAAPGSY
jgi:hypothetical protein